MNIQDMHHSSKGVTALISQTISTNTTTLGSEIDMAGYNSLEIFIYSGIITDGAYAVSLVESDTSGGTFTAVAVAEQLGNADFALADDITWKRIGYIGKKRYVKLSVISTAVTTGGVFNGGVAVQGSSITQPVAD